MLLVTLHCQCSCHDPPNIANFSLFCHLRLFSFLKMIFYMQKKVQLCLHKSRDASGSVRCLPSLFVGLFLPVCARLRAPNPRRRGAFYTSQLFVFNGGFLGEGKRTSSCPMLLLLFITAVAQFRSIGLTDK